MKWNMCDCSISYVVYHTHTNSHTLQRNSNIINFIFSLSSAGYTVSSFSFFILVLSFTNYYHQLRRCWIYFSFVSFHSYIIYLPFIKLKVLSVPSNAFGNSCHYFMDAEPANDNNLWKIVITSGANFSNLLSERRTAKKMDEEETNADRPIYMKNVTLILFNLESMEFPNNCDEVGQFGKHGNCAGHDESKIPPVEDVNIAVAKARIRPNHLSGELEWAVVQRLYC